jgi:hypothetical protein
MALGLLGAGSIIVLSALTASIRFPRACERRFPRTVHALSDMVKALGEDARAAGLVVLHGYAPSPSSVPKHNFGPSS